MFGNLTESKAGKAAVVVVAAVAVAGAVFMGVRASSGDDHHASDAEVKSSAQKQIDVIKSNPNIPPELKAEMIAHQEGLLRGGSKGAGGSAPTGASGG